MADDIYSDPALNQREDGRPEVRIQSDTALDYLWQGHAVSLFEPVEPSPEAGTEHGSAPSCLTSTLNKYNSWLASFDLYQSILAQENSDSSE